MALALPDTFSGMANAQSDVTIYGTVDTGFIKETGSDVKMGENINNALVSKDRKTLAVIPYRGGSANDSVQVSITHQF